MINADERKKLLAQVAELEKNSVNYFDVEKEFFLIDSDNLPQVRPRLNDFMDRQDIRSIGFDAYNPQQTSSRLYGYSIQRTGITFSIKSELHTYKEDYAIAFQIAEHYNFKLNQPFPTQQAFCNYSLDDILNIDFYIRQIIHKSWAILKLGKSINKTYSLSGYGGEILRGYKFGFNSLESFRQSEIRRDSYSRPLSQEIAHSREKILESTFSAIRDKYKIEDENSLWFVRYMLR